MFFVLFFKQLIQLFARVRGVATLTDICRWHEWMSAKPHLRCFKLLNWTSSLHVCSWSILQVNYFFSCISLNGNEPLKIQSMFLGVLWRIKAKIQMKGVLFVLCRCAVCSSRWWWVWVFWGFFCSFVFFFGVLPTEEIELFFMPACISGLHWGNLVKITSLGWLANVLLSPVKPWVGKRRLGLPEYEAEKGWMGGI